MDAASQPRNGPATQRRVGDHPAWLPVFLALAGGQVWMTLGLFGADHTLDPVLDPRPVLSGRHPLHLYHGTLGARVFLARGSLSCYDPAFHAGYPKTPVFDGGSRPAELALTLAGGNYRPAAYKIGLAVLCAAVPWLLLTAARGAGLSWGGGCLAAGLGLLVWWGQPCREALEAGDVDVLMAGALTVAQAGLLLGYHRRPTVGGLLGVVASSFLGWLAYPFLMALLLPPFLIYYLSVGARHTLPWHAGLLVGLVAAVGANAFWLLDWLEYWWIRVPLRLEAPVLAHRTFRTVWEAPLWGAPVDKALACLLIVAALAGGAVFNQTGRRPAARLFGLTAAGLLLLAVGGIAGEPLGRFGTATLLAPGLLFAAVPAAHGLAAALNLVRRGAGVAGGLLAAAAPVAAVAYFAPGYGCVWETRLLAPAPLRIGLSQEQEAVVVALEAHTDATARVLWEDRPGPRLATRWTALLPLLTGRNFVGGLDPEAGIEHAAAGLSGSTLAGRPLDEWTDAQLRDYCDRYNVGWVVCWSDRARERFRRWAERDGKALTRTAAVKDEGSEGTLFTVGRRHTFALRGAAQWLGADAHRIVLGDVVPEKGEVLLSLHYQAGMRAAPGRVRVEPAEVVTPDNPDSPLPFVRLRVEEPVTRVTLTWEKP
jgi:hypothetical protein